MNTAEKLDWLHSLEGANSERIAILDQQKQALIDSVYTPEIRKAVEDINAEFAPKYEAIANDPTSLATMEQIVKLRKEIEAETIEANQTLKGLYKMAVLTKEKVTEEIVVDTGMLVGMTVNIRKLQACWKRVETTTPPKVVIRKI